MRSILATLVLLIPGAGLTAQEKISIKAGEEFEEGFFLLI
jgi:hypothetical protein